MAQKSAKAGAKKSAKGGAATGKKSGGFTDAERAAMKERARELKAEATRADGEKDLLAKIAEMPEPDRGMAERLHAIVKASAPALSAKTWYGMPAYARDGKIVCFFQGAAKFDARYATLGFNDAANLDDGRMWPTSFALKELTSAEEATIAALVTKAVSWGIGPAESTDGFSARSSASKGRKVTSQIETADGAAKPISDRIAELGDWRGETLARVRSLIKEADAEVVEEWKWAKASSPGVPVWSHDGIICTGETYKDKVKLTFAKGAALADPSGLFNSSLEGNTRRAIDLLEGAQIDAAAFKALIRAAVALNATSGKKSTKRK